MSARDALRDHITGQWENGAPTAIRQWVERKLDALEAEAVRAAADELHNKTLLNDDCPCVDELRRMADEATS